MNQLEVHVDLDAYRANLERLASLASSAQTMAVVKAGGYGHGMVPVARAAREVVPWVGVATPTEALALRASGDTGPLLCWLAVPGEDYRPVLAAGIDVTASSVAQLHEILAAAGETRPRVHLKIDTGLNRNGSARSEWPALVEAARRARGRLDVVGLWSHFACADEPEHPANDAQQTAFDEAVAQARDAGLEPSLLHLANSAATVTRPSSHYDVVRVGIASYGLNPIPRGDDLGLRPVMTVRSRLAHVKEIAAGEGVSYGHRWVAEAPTRIGLIPAGYGEGIMRAAGNRCQVAVHGHRVPMVGVVCMDQFVVDLGDIEAEPGDVVTLFGSGDDGEPTAQDWADVLGTINYEIVTRLGGRIRHTYRGGR